MKKKKRKSSWMRKVRKSKTSKNSCEKAFSRTIAYHLYHHTKAVIAMWNDETLSRVQLINSDRNSLKVLWPLLTTRKKRKIRHRRFISSALEKWKPEIYAVTPKCLRACINDAFPHDRLTKKANFPQYMPADSISEQKCAAYAEGTYRAEDVFIYLQR